MPAGAPEGNKNAEKYTAKEAEELLNKALDLTNKKSDDGVYEYDFIGEVARDLGTYHHKLKYLSAKSEEAKEIHEKIKHNLEANCFYNSKKGNIKEATAIINLKANYRWSDRVDQTSNDKQITSEKVVITFDNDKPK